MFRLSKKAIYALEAVVDIAYNGRVSPVQSRDITKRQNIPQRYLEQVMQQLVRGNILKGVRGPKGGYNLARERRRITVGEIIRVISDVDIRNTKKSYNSQSDMGKKVINPLIEDLNQGIMDKLDDITLQDLCQQALNVGVEAEKEKNFNFII